MPAPSLPSWARELIELYESGAASQFILHGNVEDAFLLPGSNGATGRTGDLEAFLVDALLVPFDVVLFYDLGSGLRAVKGEDVLNKWPSQERYGGAPARPREAIAYLSHFLRYCANFRSVGRRPPTVAIVLESASLILPATGAAVGHELGAMALQVREWASDPVLARNQFASFLVTEAVNDLTPLLAGSPRAARIEIPLPGRNEVSDALRAWKPGYPVALRDIGGEAERGSEPGDPGGGAADAGGIESAASQLAGATLSSIESLLKRREHAGAPLTPADLSALKKELVEKECNGLIEFIESDRSLDDVHGQDGIKDWLRQDIALWGRNDLRALPMGYLFCGPVGTGKTFIVECLAGDAGVPVVKLKNFRDRWVGSTESNLEKIFRLLHALGRCIVFIDEADQALGRRGGGSGDSGVSGRVYSMMAEEMSKTSNRGRILWILASSRPDLIEVDLKRPGRVDIKIPIFPSATTEESFALIRALCRKFGIVLDEAAHAELGPLVPRQMTAGAAEALAVKVYRLVRTRGVSPVEALRDCLDGYQSPVPKEIMDFQIEIAAREATDLDFVPEVFRP